MIEPPHTVKSLAQPAAVIRCTIPREQIGEVMGPAIGEVVAAVIAQGIGPAGPVFSHHFRMDPETFDFEVGVPVNGAVTPAGRVQPGELPAATALRTVYQGGYEGLPEAWGEFMAWIETSDHTPAEDLWERYLAGPESSSDPGEWRTELNRPLAA